MIAEDLRVFPGGGDGTFGSAVIVDPEGAVTAVEVADLDGDGVQDLVSTDLRINLGLDSHTFAPRTDYFGGQVIEPADLDLDGRLDLVSLTDVVVISRNLGGPGSLTFLPDHRVLVWPAIVGAITYNVYRGDMNGLPGSGYGICMTGGDTDPRDTFFVDSDVPAAGETYFYLIEVVNGEGPQGIGQTSDGVVRIPAVDCP